MIKSASFSTEDPLGFLRFAAPVVCVCSATGLLGMAEK